MQKLGVAMALVGAALVALEYQGIGYDMLDWIENWGTATGWGIRVGLIVVGSLLWLLGGEKH